VEGEYEAIEKREREREEEEERKMKSSRKRLVGMKQGEGA
jgi:hypothetical protein